MYSALHPCQIVIKLELSQEIFEKYSNIKFHENLSSARRVVTWGQTDGHDETNSSFFAILPTRLKTQPVNAVQGNNRCLLSDQ